MFTAHRIFPVPNPYFSACAARDLADYLFSLSDGRCRWTRIRSSWFDQARCMVSRKLVRSSQELCLHSACATELAFCVSCIESLAANAGKPISCDGQYPVMAHARGSCTVSCSSCSILEALESHELSQRLSQRRLLCRLLDNCNRQSFIMSLHHSVQQATFLQ